MSLKDIEKLKEKVDKDPNSKLFVPLAEEYRKEGMLDEAIEELLKGLERQPGYMSARVALGKIYVEKGMLPEAKAEFENVIKSIPDNLYAHKKLAEIYRDTGDRESAIKAFRVVLRLNALDEDAQTNITDLEGAAVSEPQAAVPAGTPPETAVLPEAEEAVPEATHPTIPEEVHSMPQAVSEDDLAAFKSSLFGDEPAGAEEAVALAEEEEIGMMEEADEGAISFGDINDALEDKPVTAEPAPAAGPEPEAPEKHVEAPEPEVHAIPADPFADIPAAREPAEAEIEPQPLPVEEIKHFAPPPEPVEAQLPKAAEPEPFVPPVMPAEPRIQPAAPVAAGAEGSNVGVEDADRLVASGDFGGAIIIYKKMLERDPGDRKILQRAEELKTLLKLMGKDKEILVGKLNAFFEGITKRRDEFFRNP